MANALSSPDTVFNRTIEFCPYETKCRYRGSCRYVESTPYAIGRHLQDGVEFAAQVGKGTIGIVFLIMGFILSMTLFLLPIGVPLALIGVAFLMTAFEESSPRRS